MATDKIKIVLVDDHPLIMAGIRSIIRLNSKFKVIGEANNGENGLSIIKELCPDVAILDIDMPIMNGVELATSILELENPSKIIFLTSHTDMNTFSLATKVNYSGFVFKENALEEIEKCLLEVIEDKQYISPLFTRFIEEHEADIANLSLVKKNLESLTKSEIKVLKQIAIGKTTPEIAEALSNSYKTIENHRYNICQKLSITGSNNLLSFALDQKELINDL